MLVLRPLILAASLGAQDPGPAAVMLCERINAARSDPQASYAALPPEALPHGLDRTVLEQELDGIRPAPAMVLNPQLCLAAANHATYAAQHGRGHLQDPARAGFLGREPADRAIACGYDPLGIGENLMHAARDSDHALRGFIADWGEGPAGMLPGRPHRMILFEARFSELGVGTAEHAQGTAIVTLHAAPQSDQRILGGVVWRDRNANLRYDPGEGLGDCRISLGQATTQTWPSGAWRMEMPPETRGNLRVDHAGSFHEHALPTGDAPWWWSLNLAVQP